MAERDSLAENFSAKSGSQAESQLTFDLTAVAELFFGKKPISSLQCIRVGELKHRNSFERQKVKVLI